MMPRRCEIPSFLLIFTLAVMMAAMSFGQSRPTVPGDTLESVRGLADPNAMNQTWQTPLMAAASECDEKAVKQLIGQKASVNATSRFGFTSLMYARCLPVAELLLHAGASVNDKTLTGETALHWAVQRADPDTVRALIKAGANVNAKDDKGMSPLRLANVELRDDRFKDKSLRDAYKSRVQNVIDLLAAAGASADEKP